MKVLIDANVILDYLLGRDKENYAEQLIEKCYKGEVGGYVAFHSVSIIWYILEKNKVDTRRDMIYNLCEILEIVSISNEDIKKAIRWEEFKDFEDCLQEICAEAIHADYIITNNVNDFKNSKISVFTAADFMMNYN